MMADKGAFIFMTTGAKGPSWMFEMASGQLYYNVTSSTTPSFVEWVQSELLKRNLPPQEIYLQTPRNEHESYHVTLMPSFLGPRKQMGEKNNGKSFVPCSNYNTSTENIKYYGSIISERRSLKYNTVIL